MTSSKSSNSRNRSGRRGRGRKVRKLSMKQKRVLKELFAGTSSEAEVLKNNGVSEAVYGRWLADDIFAEQLEKRIAAARRQSDMIIAQHSSYAAAKLIELTQCEKEETVRKACLDIISWQGNSGKGMLKELADGKDAKDKTDEQADEFEELLDEETAGKILEIMAKKGRKNK